MEPACGSDTRGRHHRLGPSPAGRSVDAPPAGGEGVSGTALRGCADVAQLGEHHLAKVRVAGSNPVVRSENEARCRAGPSQPGGVAEWLRQGPAKPCTRVRFPPPPPRVLLPPSGFAAQPPNVSTTAPALPRSCRSEGD